MSATNGAAVARGRIDISVVISCFNYSRYVSRAIASALAQDGARSEVIVVDDGSTDGSRDAIASFGERVAAIFKRNGGQASALNAGFRASAGDAVIFLDADDVLLPGATGAVARALSGGKVAKAHWPMPIIDAHGRRTGEIQDPELTEGDLRTHVVERGPLCDEAMPSAAMSGNAFPRWFLNRIMPIPERAYSIGADEYLFGLAPAFGPIVRLAPLSLYRIHQRNAHAQRPFESMLAFQQRHYEIVARMVARTCELEGRAFDERPWRRSAWWLRTGRVVRAIERHVPAGEQVVLIDQGLLGIGVELRGRRMVPFPAARGEFAGAPADDERALVELERARRAGASYVALAWPAFWWTTEYPRLTTALRERRQTLVDDEDLVLFGPADRGAVIEER